jgi:hypothetical protein
MTSIAWTWWMFNALFSKFTIYGGNIQPEWGGEQFEKKESSRGRGESNCC